jgi:hypothetical protein
MVTDASGEIAETMALPNSASKGKNGGRTIPLHSELREALVALKTAREDKLRADHPVIYSERARGCSAAASRYGSTPGFVNSGCKGRRVTPAADIYHQPGEKDRRSRRFAPRRAETGRA